MMYHQGENANDGNGNPLNIGNTINRETKYATIYLFLAFALNLMVMLLSLLCGIRLEKGVKGSSAQGWLICRLEDALRVVFFAGT